MSSYNKLYFIKGGEYIKIGVSNNPYKRKTALQTGNPFKLRFICILPLGYETESLLHKHLKEYRAEGEWFEINLNKWDIIEMVAKVRKPITKRKSHEHISSDIERKVMKLIKYNHPLLKIKLSDVLENINGVSSLNTLKKHISKRTLELIKNENIYRPIPSKITLEKFISYMELIESGSDMSIRQIANELKVSNSTLALFSKIKDEE